MTIWRPHPHIRVVAIGLHWRDGRLLAAEIRDDAGRIKGVRPLGGEIEFGESWRTALMREFNEELGIDVTITSEPLVLENIFMHEGATGHEVMFICEVEFPDGAFADRDRLDFLEDDGEQIVARWFDLADLDVDGGPSLYPAGLKDVLLQPASQPD
ncbi:MULTISPECIES: NUDIX hydrolase [Bradyrhizobium]|jgi:8-oxo-dGTP pyrophosphatase MutT (NUDIX family)|uniref:NUDIX hydrolase n=1 Tax=Bradyrhizobium TaxID=374 RepID=UPI0012610160|nr:MULTISPECIES: NUDIX hydrolase [unclassified Bradyrhizobium]MDA9446861.1 DNA mismatch repair protein MutT [Bradyrhizobium sp. CCBAU 21360]MDA9457335.1 DNA mismatch repair protein MutT [Bradyrhizobium sp. CCBAU 21359]MDA9513524.1 DNA mismatch repair protein MutT [Bradyrhizobium sp. CCBAU 11430]BBO15271.1 DNA mismatch repair protein MutT [Bradyrhizobium sp. TM102]